MNGQHQSPVGCDGWRRRDRERMPLKATEGRHVNECVLPSEVLNGRAGELYDGDVSTSGELDYLARHAASGQSNLQHERKGKEIKTSGNSRLL